MLEFAFGLLLLALVGVALAKAHSLIDLRLYRSVAALDRAAAEQYQTNGFVTAAARRRRLAVEHQRAAERYERRLWWPLRPKGTF
jgi:hypothetical protein